MGSPEPPSPIEPADDYSRENNPRGNHGRQVARSKGPRTADPIVAQWISSLPHVNSNVPRGAAQRNPTVSSPPQPHGRSTRATEFNCSPLLMAVPAKLSAISAGFLRGL
ncbi:hypothetical protein DPEC_G00183060 [Dallia pectoralis]|uniref:Uncharacterized protein n=1 Tax=Dallia pectoralis TaxID=75939 RepID=A0ACC2GB47_DALPE|nr:hypothetical protein DPEC_G00183060 [Dallia pectoralis]